MFPVSCSLIDSCQFNFVSLLTTFVDSGQSLRLRGQGWRGPKGKRSDQIVKLKIVTPKKLTSQERECYEKLRQASSFNPRYSIEEVRL